MFASATPVKKNSRAWSVPKRQRQLEKPLPVKIIKADGSVEVITEPKKFKPAKVKKEAAAQA